MSLIVLDPGALSTVQDRGRPGWAHLGVPRAGALDGPAADLANRLVGNDAGAAVVETTLTGMRLEARTGVWLAVTGAECDVLVGGRLVAFGAAVYAAPGSEVVIGPARRGVRSYLAVAGGIDVPEVLGSRSTDTLAWVGPPRLAERVGLPIGPSRGRPRDHDTPRPATTGPLRLRPGPRHHWFAPGAVEALCTRTYTVAADSNRVGLRLAGDPLERRRTDELASEGMVLGAVQVPPDGQPVVLLADHPVTGGYPVIGVVAEADLHRCAQLRPGETVRFTPDRG